MFDNGMKTIDIKRILNITDTTKGSHKYISIDGGYGK